MWIPTKLLKTVEGTEEITLSNIQINTGISDSEFEF
jgi:outer membrane lipoprotein-sorting protein